MCETMNKGTCFCRCLFLVEMRGIDSRRELRGLVGRGHDSPPDCRSVPLLLRFPSSLFAKNKSKPPVKPVVCSAPIRGYCCLDP